MMDHHIFTAVLSVLSDADAVRRSGTGRSGGQQSDPIGDVHLILCGDFKQLPPATGKAPFIVLPRVQGWEFRVLRQNRRVVQDEARRDEIEQFHEILAGISMCEATQVVRDFIVAAYVRGASIGTAEHTPLEGNTAVFTKRRYRDAWNRCVTRRISKSHNHAVKIKDCLSRARFSRRWCAVVGVVVGAAFETVRVGRHTSCETDGPGRGWGGMAERQKYELGAPVGRTGIPRRESILSEARFGRRAAGCCISLEISTAPSKPNRSCTRRI